MQIVRQYFLTCDDRYITPLSVMVYSLLKNSNPSAPATVFVAHNRKFAEAGCREMLDRIVSGFPFAKAVYCDAEELLGKHRALFETKRNIWAPIIWAGPLISEVLPAGTHGKVLYLDVDMLVTRDPAPLFDTDLGEKFVGAAVAEGERSRFRDMEALEWPKEAGHYYNNGTLLLDIDRYRGRGHAEKILKWYAKYRDVAVRADQDSQNAVFGAELMRLPVKWNFNDALLYRSFLRHPFARTIRTHPRREVLEAIAEPGIIHYVNRKPWKFSHRPTRKAYHLRMKELGVFDSALDGRSLGEKLQLAIYRALHGAIRTFAKALLALSR